MGGFEMGCSDDLTTKLDLAPTPDPAVRRLTRENGLLREAVKQLEQMLPGKLGICVACKDAGCDPDEYVHPREDLEYAEDYGLVCFDCGAEFRADEDPSPTPPHDAGRETT
jgi:hypothetical protein